MTVKLRVIREVRGVEVPLGRISDPDLVEVAVRRLMRKLEDEVYTDPFQKAAAEIEKRRMLEHLAAEGYLPDDDGEGVSNGG
jgi:hypothetical protein